MVSAAKDSAARFPKVLNYQSLMALAPHKQALYLKELSEMLAQFEADTNMNITGEDRSVLRELNDQVAMFLDGSS